MEFGPQRLRSSELVGLQAGKATAFDIARIVINKENSLRFNACGGNAPPVDGGRRFAHPNFIRENAGGKVPQEFMAAFHVRDVNWIGVGEQDQAVARRQLPEEPLI